MNKEEKDLQELDLLLLRHACRAQIGEARTALVAGYPAWQRRQRRRDLLRYAAAACLAVALLIPLSATAGNGVARHPTSGQYSFADTIESIEQTMLHQ